MDELLKAQGCTQGTVGERMSALTRDPRFLYPNTDAGRAELIAYLNGRDRRDPAATCRSSPS